ncbi:sigma-70 family RNA polymerase sigma factor [bacterium]|nr:sigma-70 family RNA polymerase sigma factor [bacterium]
MKRLPVLTDSELFKKCQAGDFLAWEAFVNRHQRRVFGLANAYSRTFEDARDLAQEIFIKLYKNLGKCRDSNMLVPWMMALGRNTAIDYLRRVYRHPPAYDDETVLASIESDTPTPEEFYEVRSRKELLRRGIARLSILFREIIMLKEIQELTIIEISSILDIPIGTVKSRLFNARVELSKVVIGMCKSEVCDVKI